MYLLCIQLCGNHYYFLLSHSFGGTTIAIFRHRDQLFVFDCHARNVEGFADSDGSSILITFDSHTSIAEYLCRMYYNQVFNISLYCCEYRSSASICKLVTALLRHQDISPESIREAV